MAALPVFSFNVEANIDAYQITSLRSEKEFAYVRVGRIVKVVKRYIQLDLVLKDNAR